MRKRYLLTNLLTAQCVLAAACTIAPAQPTAPVIAATDTPAATITSHALLPSITPRTAISLDGYALAYKEMICPLKEVEFYDRYVFQADCGQQVYIPQGTAITLTLETPESQPLPIGPVPDLEALFGTLEPPFLFCQYGGADSSNTVTFGSPFQQNTGRDILCAFNVPLQGEDVVIALTGLTTR